MIIDNEILDNRCQIFTPANYVSELLNIANYKYNISNKKVLENSCGNGNIITEIVRRYIIDSLGNNVPRNKIREGLEKNIYGVEIDKKHINIAKFRLDDICNRYKIYNVKWKLFCCDYLKKDFNIKFDYIIGNPPYISYNNINYNQRIELKKLFKTCHFGKFDYCYAFVEKSINDLSSDGVMSYLIPSSTFKTVSAKYLRDFLKPWVSRIDDYSDYKLFDNATVKSSIIKISKKKKTSVILYNNKFSSYSHKIRKEELKSKWMFYEFNNSNHQKFGDFYSVNSSIATLKNSIFILGDCAEKTENYWIYKDYKLEKSLVFPAFSPNSLRKNKSLSIIFPYEVVDGSLKKIEENVFKGFYPGVYSYLKKYKNELMLRNIEKNCKWYEYGRSQALNSIFGEKLLISPIVTKKLSVFKLPNNSIPFSGLIIRTKTNNSIYSIEDAKRFLMSKKFIHYAYNIGIPLNGKSVRITSRDIENFPI